MSSAQGKQIFNANCASCHKLDKHMTGPALRNIGQICDTLTNTNFLHSAKSLIESKGYVTSYMYFPKLTETDISNILR
ncbi:MAG: cytochrome c [Winogradskyella sp.]|uniref:c-type cytochrome n=1 Tax=Winogradskyella sp. TaxID=1883156 RepID=UPI0025DF0D55|nr:cytochrome c [Winogradskyella sp.]NRB84870.1 cytochrome c [Winogradskyella sp.]